MLYSCSWHCGYIWIWWHWICKIWNCTYNVARLDTNLSLYHYNYHFSLSTCSWHCGIWYDYDSENVVNRKFCVVVNVCKQWSNTVSFIWVHLHYWSIYSQGFSYYKEAIHAGSYWLQEMFPSSISWISSFHLYDIGFTNLL